MIFILSRLFFSNIKQTLVFEKMISQTKTIYYLWCITMLQTQVREIERLWKAWVTVSEMLRDRKYEVPSDNFMSLDQFESWMDNTADITKIRQNMWYSVSHSVNKSKDIAIFWKESLGTSDIQEIIETLKSKNISQAIAIHNNKITPYAATAMRSLRVQKIIIETFSEAELQYNVTHSEYVPKHIICSAETKKKVFAEYAVGKDKITKILSSDPVCRYYGAMKGQLIKIVRPSDSISEIMDSASGEKKMLYDITYKMVA